MIPNSKNLGKIFKTAKPKDVDAIKQEASKPVPPKKDNNTTYDHERTMANGLRIFIEAYGHTLKETTTGYEGNAPWNSSSDSGTFKLYRNNGSPSYSYLAGKTDKETSGTLKDLFELCGLDWKSAIVSKEKPKAYDSSKPVSNLSEFALSKGLQCKHFLAYGWSDEVLTDYDGRPFIPYSTYTGGRKRFIDGNKPKIKSNSGTKRTWYGLEKAVNKIKHNPSLPLIICNGETSVIASHYLLGLPTISNTVGENAIPDAKMLETFKQCFSKSTNIFVIFDCDKTGMNGAGNWKDILLSNGYYNVAILQLEGESGYDLGDYAKDNPDDIESLLSLPEIVVHKTFNTGKACENTSQDYANALYMAGYYDFKYNVLSKNVEVNGKAMRDSTWSTIRNDLRDLGFNFLDSRLDDYINSENNTPRYNPLKDFFRNTKGIDVTGEEALEMLSILNQCIPTEHNNFDKWLIDFMVGAIAKLHNVDDRNFCLMMVSAIQGVGKSSFAKWLTPNLNDEFTNFDPINDDDEPIGNAGYFNAGEVKAGIQSADNLKKQHGTFIWEIREAQTSFHKTDIEEVKSILDGMSQHERSAFGREADWFRPITSYIGTANYDGTPILKDRTGAIRFVCIEWVGKADWKRYTTEIDVNKLWAYAYRLYINGYQYKPWENEDKTALQEIHNAKFIPENDYLYELEDVCDITGNPDDKVIIDDLRDSMPEFYEMAGSKKKFTSMIKQALSQYSNVVYKVIKIKGKSYNGFTGLRLKGGISGKKANQSFIKNIKRN